MRTIRLLLITLATIGTVTTAHAAWLKQVCDRNCTLAKCQSDLMMKSKCEENCQNAPDALKSCTSTIAVTSTPPKTKPMPSVSPSEQAKSGPSVPRRALPPTPSLGGSTQPSKAQQLTKSSSTIPPEALYLEKISDRLLKMTNQNCNTLIDEVFRQWVNKIPPEPAGYSKKYTKPGEKYKSARDYEVQVKQLSQSFKDLKGRVAAVVAQAKDPKGEKDYVALFEQIYGDIDLNSRKNCERYTTDLKTELREQRTRIAEYNNSFGQKIQRIFK